MSARTLTPEQPSKELATEAAFRRTMRVAMPVDPGEAPGLGLHGGVLFGGSRTAQRTPGDHALERLRSPRTQMDLALALVEEDHEARSRSTMYAPEFSAHSAGSMIEIEGKR